MYFYFHSLSNQLFVYNLTQVFEEIDAPKPTELGGKNENASSAFDALVGTVYVWWLKVIKNTPTNKFLLE